MNNTDRLCLGCMNDNGGADVCPICGYEKGTKTDATLLTPGTWIKERYLLGRMIETTGEGVTYIGWDNLNNNVVYIKEYLPTGLCERTEDGSVSITVGKEYDYNNGIMQFIDISKKCELLVLPCLMPVIETIEFGGTAYSIIKASAGITLREFLLRNGGTLKWEQAKPLFMPLLSTLEGLHKERIYHCGISPETIIVGRDGKLHLSSVAVPQLRHAASEFTSQIFPGFAAIEQYEAERTVGTYTDVYGVAATLFRVLIGNPPMAANERIVRDNMSIPAKAAETIPPYVLTALANALQIESDNRTATMSDLRDELTAASGELYKVSPKSTDTKIKKGSSKRYALIAAAATAGVLLLIAAILVFTVFRDQLFAADENSSTASVSAPSVSSHGDIDSSYDNTPVERLYDVPKLVGAKYSDVINNVEYTQIFKFNVKGTQFDSKVPEGSIISQSVKEGERVKKETEIDIVISAGSAELVVPSLAGDSQVDAYIKLLELGFSKDNIEFMERYDDTQPPQLIISTEPQEGTKISRYDKILVFVNSYEEPEGEYDTYESSSEEDSTEQE